jgi:endonuclease III
MHIEQKREVLAALCKFIMAVANESKIATPEELEALPGVAEIVLSVIPG